MARWYAHRARIAFFVTAAVTALVTLAVLWPRRRLFDVPLVPSSVAVVLLAVLAGVACGLVGATVVRAWPVLRALWWWALELAVLGLLVTSMLGLSQLALWLAVVVPAAVTALLVLVRPVRRRMVAWAWCVVVRHRLRLCFAEFVRAATRARPASLPLLLWARTTP